MKVTAIEGDQDDILIPPVATVEARGVTSRIRLDIVDRMPRVGDYVIVHAGFAIHTLAPEDARKSMALLQEMAGQTNDNQPR